MQLDKIKSRNMIGRMFTVFLVKLQPSERNNLFYRSNNRNIRKTNSFIFLGCMFDICWIKVNIRFEAGPASAT